MTLKQAAQKSTDDRWLPISQAGSIGEMDEIFDRTRCTMCRYQAKINGLWIGRCKTCLLDDDNNDICCNEFNDCIDAIVANDLPAAQAAANAMVDRLRKIAEGS